jgi:hypothetical protein
MGMMTWSILEVFGLQCDEVHKDGCITATKVCDEVCGKILYRTGVGYI